MRPAIATARRVRAGSLESKYADPTYHPASLLAALLLKEHLRLTYRGVEDLLSLSDRLCRLFGLRIVPDHSTLWWFGRRRLSASLIAAALGETVERAAEKVRGPWLGRWTRLGSGYRTHRATSSGAPGVAAASGAD